MRTQTTNLFLVEDLEDVGRTALTAFLAPYRDSLAAAHTTRPDAVAVR